jgi:uncharacterized protein YecE (DUF72 family)
MKRRTNIHIGTSGWHYEHWKGVFYPEGVSGDGLLGYYTGKFQTVELNNTFYQLPRETTLMHWRDMAPEGFIFSVKASRYITHMKKLKDPKEPLSNFLKRIEALGDRLGPILFQLPPRWRSNPERLASFLKILPEGFRYAFEFRDPSWFNREVYDMLMEHGAAFCIFDLAGMLSPKEMTAEFVYVRLHGPAGAYQGQYDAAALAGWAGAFSTWSRQGYEIFCYFDNDEAGYAAQDALRLKEMTGGAA